MFNMNLQYFAEDGANAGAANQISEATDNTDLKETTDYADEPSDDEVDETEGQVDEPEEQHVQSAEENAKYAAARREAEAREKAVRDEMSNLDKMVAEQFGEYENPITHEKVNGVKAYFEALNAQKQYHAQQEMQKAGINPNIINELIQNNPVILQAQEVLANQQRAEQARVIQGELDQIHSLDASITTPDDLLNMENFEDFKGYVNKGYSFIDSFKLANFSKLQQKSSDAAKQAAINQAKSTSHLQSTSGLSTGSNELKDIPTGELAVWKECYPDLTMKQLKEKYNKTLH